MYEYWVDHKEMVIWEGLLKLKGTLRYKDYKAVLTNEPCLYLYRLGTHDLRQAFDFKHYYIENKSTYKMLIVNKDNSPLPLGQPRSYKLKRSSDQIPVERLIAMVFTNS